MSTNMRLIEIPVCSSELLLDLTFQTTINELDSRFVSCVATVLETHHVELYIGHFLVDTMPTLIAEFQSSSVHNPDSIHKTILPIHLVSGKTLSLLVDAEPSDEQMMVLVQLIALYVNQHEHLSRSNKDRLTGLNNRRSFDLEYQNLVDESKGEAGKGVIAIVDVDHFKRVNDVHGHIIGDETLITVSNIMKAFFDREDVLYRFGGEEFVVLFRDISDVEAEIILEQLRKEIEHHRFPQIETLTVSIGLVALNSIDDILLFERADAALYFAKKSGRNCVKSYERLVLEGEMEPIEHKSGDVELF